MVLSGAHPIQFRQLFRCHPLVYTRCKWYGETGWTIQGFDLSCYKWYIWSNIPARRIISLFFGCLPTCFGCWRHIARKCVAVQDGSRSCQLEAGGWSWLRFSVPNSWYFAYWQPSISQDTFGLRFVASGHFRGLWEGCLLFQREYKDLSWSFENQLLVFLRLFLGRDGRWKPCWCYFSETRIVFRNVPLYGLEKPDRGVET